MLFSRRAQRTKMEGGYLHENVNLASVLFPSGEKQAPTFGEHSFFLALRDKNKGLHSSEGYNLYFLALRDTERGGKCKEKTTCNFAPVGIRQFRRARRKHTEFDFRRLTCVPCLFGRPPRREGSLFHDIVPFFPQG